MFVKAKLLLILLKHLVFMAKSRKGRKLDHLSKKKEISETIVEPVKEIKTGVEKVSHKNSFDRIYDTQYKKLVFIPIVLLILAFLIIGMNYVQTGDFINKGVSLKGGLTLTISTKQLINLDELTSYLQLNFQDYDVSIRGLSEFGTSQGIMIESDVGSDMRGEFISLLEEKLGISQEDFSIEEVGSSLGSSFFKQTMIAILIAFVFMGLVVFLYFRTIIPSLAVILAAFSDIVITIAIVDLLDVKIGTAGIAAFLMLIGYSVDTDILLSTRVLKRKEGTIMDRIYGAMKTGLIMNTTTIVAVTIGFIVSDSEVIKQIMLVILIGLLVDIINTWLENVAILRYYLEKKNIK